MDFGRVVGTVVCTIKDPLLEGIRLAIVEPLDHSSEVAGRLLVAADAVGAGDGQIIYYETAREAPFAFPTQPPIDAAIIGIIDSLETI